MSLSAMIDNKYLLQDREVVSAQTTPMCAYKPATHHALKVLLLGYE